MLTNERVLLNISWNKKTYFGIQKIEDCILIFDSNKEKRIYLLFDKFMWTRRVSDEN